MIIIIKKEKSGSATITTHSQSPIPSGREKGQQSVRAKYVFFFFFAFFKMSKAFTLEKSQKKKKKKNAFLFMACTPVYFIVYDICGTSLQFVQNSNPTLQGPTTPISYR